MNNEKVRRSIELWPRAIECGIFRPETMPYIPFHDQCELDTCIMGWLPSIFKESIDQWIDKFSEATTNKTETKRIKEDIPKLYAEFRLANYLRAYILQKINRSLLTKRKHDIAKHVKAPSQNINANPKMKQSWIFGARKDDQVSDLEDDQEMDGDHLTENEMTDPLHNAVNPTQQKTEEQTKKLQKICKVDCTQERCRIARMIGTKTGMVTKKHLS